MGWKEPEIGSSPLVARLIGIRANSKRRRAETDLAIDAVNQNLAKPE